MFISKSMNVYDIVKKMSGSSESAKIDKLRIWDLSVGDIQD